MSHYDNSRPGYCARCGAAPGNIRADGTCEFCTPRDRWAVWPDGTTCSLLERRDLEELLTWKSDDYEILEAVEYDETSSPIFENR